MKKWSYFLQTESHSIAVSVALLLVRCVVGLAFIYHGWGKIQTPFNWMPPDGPMAIPGIFQFLAAFSEFGGGVALIIGLLTRLASLGLFFTMVVAVYMHAIVMGDPFVSSSPAGGSYELSMVYLVVLVLLFLLGAGKISLDSLVFGKK